MRVGGFKPTFVIIMLTNTSDTWIRYGDDDSVAYYCQEFSVGESSSISPDFSINTVVGERENVVCSIWGTPNDPIRAD